MTCPDYDDEHTDSTGDYGYGDDEKTTDDDHSYGDDDECSDSTDSDTPSGTDAVDGSDKSDAKMVPNLKLKAIRNVKSQAMNSQTSLSEWTTSAQSIPLAAGTSDIKKRYGYAQVEITLSLLVYHDALIDLDEEKFLSQRNPTPIGS